MKRNIGIETPLYPAPDLIVATYDGDGRPNGMAAAWGGVCCSEPPCIAVAVRKERYSYRAISERKAFTVNIPSEDLVDKADLFGLCSGADHDKFALTGLTARKGTEVDAPTIEEFPVSMECRLLKAVEIGSHVQFIGQVVACWVADDCLDDHGKPSPERVRPVLFMPQSGRYYGMGREIARAYKAGRKFLEEGRS